MATPQQDWRNADLGEYLDAAKGARPAAARAAILGLVRMLMAARRDADAVCRLIENDTEHETDGRRHGDE